MIKIEIKCNLAACKKCITTYSLNKKKLQRAKIGGICYWCKSKLDAEDAEGEK